MGRNAIKRVLFCALLAGAAFLLGACSAVKISDGMPEHGSIKKSVVHRLRYADEVSPDTVYKVVLPGGITADRPFEKLPEPERFYDEVVQELRENPGYGEIYPFLHRRRGLYEMQAFGFCNARGLVICEPVFNEVELLSHGGKEFYYAKILSVDDEIAHPNSAMQSREFLATPDGKKVLSGTTIRLKNSAYGGYGQLVTESETYDDYINVLNGGTWKVYDWNFKEVLPGQYQEPVYFSEGVAAALLPGESQYYYIDTAGNRVLGPLGVPPRGDKEPYGDPFEEVDLLGEFVFRDGIAKYYHNGRYGYIDKSGQIVLEAVYDHISLFTEGVAAVMVSGGAAGNTESYLIDREGNDLFGGKHKEGMIIVGGNGVFYTTDDGGLSIGETFDKNGNPLQGGGYREIMSGALPGGYSYTQGDKALILEKDGKSWRFENERISGYRGEACFETYRESSRSDRIYAYPNKLLFEGKYIYNIGRLFKVHREDESGKKYNTSYYDENGKEYPGLKPYEIWQTFGEYAPAEDEVSTGLVDFEGNWIIRISKLRNADD